MTELNLNLDWDVEDGSLVAYVSQAETDNEIAALYLDKTTILESFVEDLRNSPDTFLQDWADLAEDLQSIVNVINYTMEPDE